MIRYTLAALLLTTAAHADTLPGYDRLTLPAAHRDTALKAAVWYPAGTPTYQSTIGEDTVFVGTKAMVGASAADGTYPLVVMSHGSGGNMDNMGWLAGALAQQGVIVLGVNHPGSTSGDSSPRRAIRAWDRTADVTAALDAILTDPTFGPHIDARRITVLGFSMGGGTALQLAGARLSQAQYTQYCATVGDQGVDCRYFAKGGVDVNALPPEWEGDAHDPRISAAIAIDPAYTWAMTPASIAALNTPTLLINLGTPDTRWKAVSVGPEGSNIAARLPAATLTQIAPAHHFTFLDLCKPGAAAELEKVDEDPICTDPKGVDRADVHQQIIAKVVDFLKP